MGLTIYYKNPNAPSPTQPFSPGVCAVITNTKDQILLHKRTDCKKWSLPGGKMKIGESISDCCRRELKEEMNIDIKIKKIIGIYTSPDCIFDFGKGYIFQPFVVAFLCTSIKDNFTINKESIDAQWFNQDEISSLDLVPYVDKIIHHAFHNSDTFFD